MRSGTGRGPRAALSRRCSLILHPYRLSPAWPPCFRIGCMTSSTNTSYTLAPQSRATAENFPVAGWFLSARVRPAVRAYYAFARTADDIADSNTLTVIQKLATLDALETSLDETALSQVMRTHNIALNNVTDLLVAFRNDARGTLIKTCADLMSYCRYSAVPVGRFLLALHREAQGQTESDALCAALQILNHVQDCRADAENLKRCYIPLEWLNTAGIDLIDVFDPANLTNYGPGYTPI
ncbi:MAG: hypothetical protein EXR11_10510, partial [Rhodospirillaceae bacterium]|nr:hypothetical protein [Rhodospirillaceae bacterium]